MKELDLTDREIILNEKYLLDSITGDVQMNYDTWHKYFDNFDLAFDVGVIDEYNHKEFALVRVQREVYDKHRDDEKLEIEIIQVPEGFEESDIQKLISDHTKLVTDLITEFINEWESNGLD